MEVTPPVVGLQEAGGADEDAFVGHYPTGLAQGHEGLPEMFKHRYAEDEAESLRAARESMRIGEEVCLRRTVVKAQVPVARMFACTLVHSRSTPDIERPVAVSAPGEVCQSPPVRCGGTGKPAQSTCGTGFGFSALVAGGPSFATREP